MCSPPPPAKCRTPSPRDIAVNTTAPHVPIIYDRYRETHHITEEVHKGFLKEQGWTEEEYYIGFQQNKAPRDGSARFLEYEALVARELSDGEVRSRAGGCS